MSQPFEKVREDLLRAGIAPRHVRRYVIELREHLADLTERERKAGLDAAAASQRARELVGTDSQLTQAMLQKAPRALAARAPWAVFGLLPLVALIAVVAAIDYSMFRLLTPVNVPAQGGVPATYLGVIAAVSFITSYLLGPVIAAGCLFISLRQRVASLWLWIGVAVVALASNLFGFHMNVQAPIAGHPGGTSFSALPVVYVDGHVSAAATLAMVALRAVILFVIAAVAYRALRARFTSSAA